MPLLSVIQSAVLRRVSKLGLPAGARVLDAPCGAGALALSLTQAGFEAWGVDLEEEARPFLHERFLLGDLNGPLPWPDASFHALFSIEGIEHLENRFSFLREAHRVLRPEGTLLITTPNIVSLRSRMRFLGSGFFHRDSRPLNESQRHPLHHIGLSTFSDVRYALHTSGFVLSHVSFTHVKPVSYLYAVFAPWMYLYTLIAFRKEKDPAQQERNREIRRTLFSPALLFGENLLLIAKKVDTTRTAQRFVQGRSQ
jgi:ubiquinone/menaquinone biosynthesis C-methylase UbiE